MQKFSILAVLVAMSLACGTFRADARQDTPAQAAARAALEQQMTQMDNEQGSTNSMTPPTAPSAPPATPSAPPAAPPALPPITTPTPQFSTNIPMNTATEEETAPARMSDTNEPPMAQMQSQTNVGAMTVPPSVLNTHETEQYPVNPPMAPLPPPQGESSPTPPPVSTQQTHPVPVPASGSGNQWPTPAQSNPNAQQIPPVVASGPGSTMNPGAGPNLNSEPRNATNSVPNFESITAPPLPINQQQQAELQSLLSQYMANQITPEQYQEQREKILGQQ